MQTIRRNAPASFLAIGLVFLVIGFVQQGFALSFDSGFFNLGVIFTLSGLVGTALQRKSGV
jgi:hypothetical protein